MSEQMTVGDLPSALDHWDEVKARIGGRPPAVFLDYDGTLTPIVDRPQDALLSPETRVVLEQLRQTHPVGIISGRDLDDVRQMVGVEGIAYAGSHGFDILTPDGHRIGQDEGWVELMAEVGSELEQKLDGVTIEPKRYAVAVHYRGVDPESVPGIESVVREATARRSGLVVTGGKRIYEIRPDIPWDKGAALRHLLELLDLTGPEVAPLYFGDDLTDEDALAEVSHSGVGFVVRGEDDARPTAAHFSLRDPTETREALERLAA